MELYSLVIIIPLVVFIVIVVCMVIANTADYTVNVNSARAVTNYDLTRVFKEHPELIGVIENRLRENGNKAYKVRILYVSPAGRKTRYRDILVDMGDIVKYQNDPTLLMSKEEFNRYIKDKTKEELEAKQKEYYDKVNEIVDYANNAKDSLIVEGAQDRLDKAIDNLFNKTVNSIKKIKTIDSEEWTLIKNVIDNSSDTVERIVKENKQIADYYRSEEFRKIKDTCKTLMDSQREFNEYIDDKVDSIASMLGTRVIRNETEINDENNYIRPYKKTVTPFTADVSAQVFQSAENNPLEYIIKYFYPNKSMYKVQINKLSQLIEEIETLKEAKRIIDNYKAEYKDYIKDVPEYVMQNDRDGFYSRLGFANITESTLTVEYKFSYTSAGGMAQRSFTVPMTEEHITELIKTLENKLTLKEMAKEQRGLMTKRLRERIKERDDYTCCNCLNSTYEEPNLLLEIDHIVPVSKGGLTVESNLQTLCWRCNRAKSNK